MIAFAHGKSLVFISVPNPGVQESTACGKSALPEDLRFRNAGALPRRGRSADSPTTRVPCLPVSIRSRAAGDAATAARVSSDDYEFLCCIRRQRAQGLLSPVFQNEGDRLTEVRKTFFAVLALAVSPRHLGAVRDIPWPVTFDNRRELVPHGPFYPINTARMAWSRFP